MPPRFLHQAALVAVSITSLTATAAWRGGLDLISESSLGLRGSGRGGTAWHHLGLGSVEWTPVPGQVDGWQHQVFLSGLILAGKGPSARFVNDFSGLSNSEGHESARLYSWWFQTGRASWSCRLGALLADEEFAGTDGGANLINSSFGWPAHVSANTRNTGPAFYVAALGVRFAHAWSEQWSWRVGIFDGDTFDSPDGVPELTRHGLRYELTREQGAFLMSELVFTPTASRAWRYKLGGWWHTADFAHMHYDASGQPYLRSGDDPAQLHTNHGFYAVAEKTLTGQRGEAGHLEFFARAGVAPADRNALAWSLDTGLAWTGPFPGRPADVMALGLAHAAFGEEFAATEQLANPAIPRPDYEQIIEFSYTFVLNDRLSLQPDLQLIRHPGGDATRPAALVALLRLNASF